MILLHGVVIDESTLCFGNVASLVIPFNCFIAHHTQSIFIALQSELDEICVKLIFESNWDKPTILSRTIQWIT